MWIYTPSDQYPHWKHVNTPINLKHVSYMIRGRYREKEESDQEAWMIKFVTVQDHAIHNHRWLFDSEDERNSHWANIMNKMECV